MKLLRIVLCMALLAVSVSMAQTTPGNMTVDVPFAFVAAGQTLPAGHYIVKTADDGYIRICGSKSSGIYIVTHAAERAASDGTKLVFHRYGDTYFLSTVWTSGNPTGRELFPSRAEREIATRNVEMELAVVRQAGR